MFKASACTRRVAVLVLARPWDSFQRPLQASHALPAPHPRPHAGITAEGDNRVLFQKGELPCGPGLLLMVTRRLEGLFLRLRLPAPQRPTGCRCLQQYCLVISLSCKPPFAAHLQWQRS